MHRLWIGTGGVLGATAVAMAAVAAHALTTLSPAMTAGGASGIQMQGWHALALIATGVWSQRRGGVAHWAGAAFLLGTVLFCAAVYSLALADTSLGLVAPTGGWLLMRGW